MSSGNGKLCCFADFFSVFNGIPTYHHVVAVAIRNNARNSCRQIFIIYSNLISYLNSLCTSRFDSGFNGGNSSGFWFVGVQIASVDRIRGSAANGNVDGLLEFRTRLVRRGRRLEVGGVAALHRRHVTPNRSIEIGCARIVAPNRCHTANRGGLLAIAVNREAVLFPHALNRIVEVIRILRPIASAGPLLADYIIPAVVGVDDAESLFDKVCRLCIAIRACIPVAD